MKRSHQQLSLAVVVSLITFVQYLPVLRNGFVLWDDDRYVYNNIHIRSLDLAFLKWAFTDISEHFWQPLAWFYHALDHALWGLDPLGHHLTSMLLHSVNAFLVVLLAVRLLEAAGRAGGSPVTGDRSVLIAAGSTGLLFGMHPLQVETVAWVTAKHDLLFTFFFLLSVLSYLAFSAGREIETIKSGPKAAFFHKQYLLSFGLFVLSLASKPSAVVLPAVLLLLDWHPLRRVRSGKDFLFSLIEKLPYLIPGLIVSIGTVFAHQARGGMASLESVPFVTRLLVSAKALLLYLWKMVYPFHLSPYYPYPKDATSWSLEYASAVMLLFVITAACVLVAKKRPAALAVWLFFLLTLLPVLGIFKVRDVFMADRYMYLSGLGLFLPVGVLITRGWARIGSAERLREIVKPATVILMVTLFLMLAFLTVKQVAVWKDGITLWSRVIEAEPVRAPSAYVSRGWAFKEAGQTDRALEDFDRAIALDTAPPYLAYNNRGII
ncbi:MAG TPA: tetratricopeptide repeat protein, partial [Nitrospirota bacterium]|nr:tetratricopeptide repeat protein [Nitrospirota bacterium]